MNEVLARTRRLYGSLHKPTLVLLGAAFLGGMIGAFWLRFTLVQENKTHYHANFALYINGIRDEFDSFTFYEEVAACAANIKDDPKIRVHMHDKINHVVHVHDDGVIWSSFFANLGYGMTDKSLVVGGNLYADGQDGKKLRFYLNGSPVSNISGEVIRSEDVLLIDYSSDEDSVLKSRYENILKDARVYNEKDDPSSCTGSKQETFSHRLKRTLGVEEQ